MNRLKADINMPRRLLRSLPGGRDLCRARATRVWRDAEQRQDKRVARNSLSGAVAGER